MRRIVIAEMLILGLWALYLGIVLTQASGNEVKRDSAWGQAQSQNSERRKRATPLGHAASIEAFATGLRIATESNPLVGPKYLKHPG
jgi:hypothetical protein